jgi:chromosome segregation ATPase
MLANRMKSFRSQLQNQVDANRTQLQENETELARILPLKRHDQDWKWRVADSRAGIRDAKKEIRSLEKHLVAKLDSLTNFQKAIEAVEEEYGQWRINNRSTKKFIVDPKYKFTPAMFKKAWAYANNEPVEGLK